jgi:hypothetical protein
VFSEDPRVNPFSYHLYDLGNIPGKGGKNNPKGVFFGVLNKG